jgi:S-adenosylmethionine:tRNA ribosyltransferase-isomerase
MKTDELNYYLPAELIAQQPVGVRSDSKLLVFNRFDKELTDSNFVRIGEFLSSGDCLVLNDTKVLPARFFGERRSGGKLEALFLTESDTGMWEVMLKGARKVRRGESICLKDKTKNDFCEAEVFEKKGEGKCLLRIKTDANAETVLERIGFPPLPPYIKRGDDLNQAATDKLRYQTVYARHSGSVAAPTAGLHFTDELIKQLKQSGVRFSYITLHVGEGTFKPIATGNIAEHKMHQERFSVDEENARMINAVREKGGRIIAVGTTSVRVLETVTCGRGESKIKAATGATSLFINPGYTFKAVDAMITNFHLPRSTLLALVAAFAGLENILTAYQYAVEKRYRFYSYGDAMLII